MVGYRHDLCVGNNADLAGHILPEKFIRAAQPNGKKPPANKSEAAGSGAFYCPDGNPAQPSVSAQMCSNQALLYSKLSSSLSRDAPPPGCRM